MVAPVVGEVIDGSVIGVQSATEAIANNSYDLALVRPVSPRRVGCVVRVRRIGSGLQPPGYRSNHVPKLGEGCCRIIPFTNARGDPNSLSVMGPAVEVVEGPVFF